MRMISECVVAEVYPSLWTSRFPRDDRDRIRLARERQVNVRGGPHRQGHRGTGISANLILSIRLVLMERDTIIDHTHSVYGEPERVDKFGQEFEQ